MSTSDAIEAPPTDAVDERLRGPVTALLLSGGLLVLLGQSSYVDAAALWQQRLTWLLMGLGGLAFVVAGQTAVRQRPPRLAIKPGLWLAGCFNVTTGQVVLLLFAPLLALMATLAAGDKLQARHASVAIAAWLLSIAFVVVGSWEQGDNWRIPVSRRVIGATAVLFAIALFLRASITDNIPTTLSGDEGAAGLISLQFVEGTANNPFSFGWFSFPSLYFAVQGWGIDLWGRTTEGLRLTSALAGAAAVVAVYWLARTMFDRVTGALTAVYLAASHYHIHVSRIGLNNVWDSLFGTVATLGLWYGWHRGKRIGFILCGLALGLGQYFYVSIRVLPIIFLLWAGAALWRDRETFKRRLPGLILAAYVAFVVFQPLGLLFAQHPNEFNAPLNRVTILGDWLAARTGPGGQTAVQIVLNNIKTAALGFTQMPLRLLYEASVPLLLTGAATLFIMGLLWAITHFDLRYLLLILPMVAVIILSGLGQDPPAAQRYILSMPMVAVLVALPLGLVVKWLRGLWPDYGRWVMVAVTAVMLWVVAVDLDFYFVRAYGYFVLGGINTETATDVAHYLQDRDTPQQTVYFFGFPRMGYYSLGTVPYLVSEAVGIDVPAEPITTQPEWVLNGPTIFIFLPERLGELGLVQRTYPNGSYREFFSDVNGQMLFASYEVVP
jgi:4-amino-4-deoxy-L-arabinose transferase-like glycosyltransferase